MIKSVKKIPILRYGLIVLLVCILFGGAFTLYIRYNSAQNLQDDVSHMIVARENSALIDSCLLNLYDADNNSRLYVVTSNKAYLTIFVNQVNHLEALLDKIRTEDESVANSDQLKSLIGQKRAKTASYIKLRLYTDSLIRLSSKINKTLSVARVKIPSTTIKTVKTDVKVDTIKPNDKALAADQPKKKFLGRLLASITGKNKPKPADAELLVRRDTIINTTVKTGEVYAPIPKKARNYYRNLNSVNDKLRASEHEILLINNNLLSGIITELRQYKTIEQNYVSSSKVRLAGKVTDVFKEYNSLSKLTLVSLILLILIVLYNIWKIFDNERKLIDSTDKAEEYAINKSSFVASMSHEIRTPLNSVIGFSEQLGGSNLTAEQTVQVNAIRGSARLLLDVVNEILDFSKYETGKMTFEQQPFMLASVLNDVYNTVAIQAAKKDVNLRKSFVFEDGICFTGDALRLKQVVMNLMVNAIKFTPAGEVLLQVMLVKQTAGGATLRVRVKDTGIGIAKKDLKGVFDEFSQVDDAQKVTRHKGTGLGLAICKKIVELQGGKLRAISEPGKGSMFTFELPFALANKEDCIEQETVSNTQLQQLVAGAHVLLAEDNKLNVLLAKTILKKWNVTCDVAYNGQDAFDLFEANNYDMVLTDIEMPVMGGVELMKALRKYSVAQKAETYIIAMTANVLKQDRDTYYQAGANDILLKPFTERDMIEKISLALKTGELSRHDRDFLFSTDLS